MKAPRARRRAAAAAESEGVQYLVFGVGGEEYALPLLEVREIVGLAGLSSPAESAPARAGVVDVRGEALPVVDMAIVLGAKPAAVTPESCALIGWQQRVGLLVECVRRVIGLAEHQVSAAPRLGSLASVDLVRAVARTGEGLVPVLDLERLLGSDEVRAAVDSWRAAGLAPEPRGAAR